MDWTFEKGLEAFASMNPKHVPGAVCVEVDGRLVDVVKAEVGIGCVLTERGMTLLSGINAAPADKPKAKVHKPKAVVVESANTSADDDLNLSE